MKKKDMINLILATIIIVPIVYAVFSQTIIGNSANILFKADVTQLPPPQTAEENAAAATAAAERLEALNTQKAAAEEQREARGAALTQAENDLTATNRALENARAAGQNTDALVAEQKAKQEAVNKAKTDFDSANKIVNDTNTQIEASPEMKARRLNERYNELVQATTEKGNQISQKVATTPEEQAIKEQQLTANGQYVALLNARRDLELCQLEVPSCESQAQLQANLDEISRVLREQISVLTDAEQRLNKGMTFNVSDIFKPAGQAAKKLSLLDVTNKIANWMITLVSSLAVTALIIGGFMMIISAGDESRLETGKTIFTYSLIGLAVTLAAYGIIATIQSLFI